MDLTGKKGEQAAEGVQNISQRLEELESHINALDDAVQDNQDKIQQFSSIENTVANLRDELGDYFRNYNSRIQSLEGMRESVEQDIDSNSDRISGLEKMNVKLEDRLDDLEESVEDNSDSISELKNQIESLQEDINNIEARSEDADVSEFEDKIDQKVDRNRFKSRQRAVNHEINKLRTSINALADSIDENDKIEIDS